MFRSKIKKAVNLTALLVFFEKVEYLLFSYLPNGHRARDLIANN
jgi:hypothetical protein